MNLGSLLRSAAFFGVEGRRRGDGYSAFGGRGSFCEAEPWVGWLKGDSNWKTRSSYIRFPHCGGAPSWASPSTAKRGSWVSFQVSFCLKLDGFVYTPREPTETSDPFGARSGLPWHWEMRGLYASWLSDGARPLALLLFMFHD